MTWTVVTEAIRLRYPDVRHLSTDALADRLGSSDPDPVLLDVRTAEEYAVSHLPGARRVSPDTAGTPPALADVGHDACVVLYCSVGYRSSALAQMLMRAGFTQIYNLEGSIFKWANEGRPLVDRDGPARVVHPYNRLWGYLLDDEVRAVLS